MPWKNQNILHWLSDMQYSIHDISIVLQFSSEIDIVILNSQNSTSEIRDQVIQKKQVVAW